ncbi:MAG TPA: iron ABC transporter permease [Planctomycetota bacterium]|nr:iron ABC transporter permease [Planctomycetota bacterium]
MKLARSARVGLLLLALAGALAAALGTVDIPPARVARVALATVGIGDTSGIPPTEVAILQNVRFPRVCLLALVGAALAIAGATLQATFQNPMADPGILGVTGGGAFGAVLAIHLGIVERVALALPAFAFAGALTGATLVYVVSYLGGRPTTTTLLLTGIAIGSLAAAGMSLLLVGTQEYRVKEVLFWLVGGAEGRTWSHVQLVAPPVLIGALALLLAHRPIDTLALGEEHALSVGVPVQRTRLLLLSACALVAGAAVSVSGSIAFVGLIVPHAIRYLVGASSRTLLPACLLGGATFLVLCDAAARVLSRAGEIHLGILTAFLGVPFLLLLIYRGKRALA